jgi:hypothetical protein
MDTKGSPHLEERLNSGKLDLDLFFIFSQINARIMDE